MTRKLTKWFDADVTPKSHGVYQRDYAGKELLKVVYSHWDGKKWGIFGYTAKEAAEQADLKSSYQNFKWRGLAEKPGK